MPRFCGKLSSVDRGFDKPVYGMIERQTNPISWVGQLYPQAGGGGGIEEGEEYRLDLDSGLSLTVMIRSVGVNLGSWGSRLNSAARDGR